MTTLAEQPAPTGDAAAVRRLQNYVDGQWIDAATDEWGYVSNPATGKVLAQVPYSTSADVDRAVQAARAAFPAWRDRPPLERARYLFKLKNIMEEHFEELALDPGGRGRQGIAGCAPRDAPGY